MKSTFRGKATMTMILPVVIDGKFVDKANTFEVRVMAIAEEYAMVRRKGAMPFVCNVKDLIELGI